MFACLHGTRLTAHLERDTPELAQGTLMADTSILQALMTHMVAPTMQHKQWLPMRSKLSSNTGTDGGIAMSVRKLEKCTCVRHSCHWSGAMAHQSAMMPRTAPSGGHPVASSLGAHVHWLLKPVGVQHWLSSTSWPPMVARQDHKLLLDLNFPPGSSSCTDNMYYL